MAQGGFNKIVTIKDPDTNRQIDAMVEKQFRLDISNISDATAGTIVAQFNALLAAIRAQNS